MARLISDLNASELAFTQIAANVSDYAIYILDVNGNVTSWNKGAERIKGYTAEEIIGQHYSRFYLPEAAKEGVPARNLKLAKQAGHFEDDGWRVRKDGSRFWASVVITPLYSPDGQHIGFSKITRDMTGHQALLQELKQRAAELEQRTRELQEANSAMESFSYSVSHDLRAPLRAMWGFAVAIAEDYHDKLDETGRQYAQAIVDAATSMDRLIEDLLAYSRLDRAELQLARVELNEALQDARQQIDSEIRNRNAALESGPLLGEVQAHYTTLVQVLVNLLSNGMKFVAEGVRPEIRVRSESSDGRVRLWVEDNGIGIAAEHQQQIFLPFERLHGVEQYPGTGIGLAFVRKAVERMGGQSGVESTIGRGSSFWIELRKG